MRFSDFVTLQRGFDLPRTEMRDGPFPVLGSTSVIGQHSEYKVEPPGVVTGRSGSLGIVQYVDQRYWPHNTALWVKDFKGNDPEFVYYCMMGLDFARFNAGAGVPTLNRNHLDSLEIDVPPVPIQRRIVRILSAYDQLIENSERRIKILESMARALYREWFVHFRFPGHESVPRVPSSLGEIPKGWDVKPLEQSVDDIVDYRGKTPAKLGGDWTDNGILALSALNVKAGRLVNLDKSKCVDEDLYRRWMKNPLRQGDILMTSEAPLGELFFLCKHERYCLSQRLFSIRANREVISPVILYLNLGSELTQNEIRSRASGATVSGIRQSELRKIPLLIPTPEVQIRTGPILQQLAEQIHTLDSQIRNLRRTRDLLLPRLMSGQIGVEAIPA